MKQRSNKSGIAVHDIVLVVGLALASGLNAGLGLAASPEPSKEVTTDMLPRMQIWPCGLIEFCQPDGTVEQVPSGTHVSAIGQRDGRWKFYDNDTGAALVGERCLGHTWKPGPPKKPGATHDEQ